MAVWNTCVHTQIHKAQRCLGNTRAPEVSCIALQAGSPRGFALTTLVAASSPPREAPFQLSSCRCCLESVQCCSMKCLL